METWPSELKRKLKKLKDRSKCQDVKPDPNFITYSFRERTCKKELKVMGIL